jgi:hypothetical protein
VGKGKKGEARKRRKREEYFRKGKRKARIEAFDQKGRKNGRYRGKGMKKREIK